MGNRPGAMAIRWSLLILGMLLVFRCVEPYLHGLVGILLSSERGFKKAGPIHQTTGRCDANTNLSTRVPDGSS